MGHAVTFGALVLPNELWPAQRARWERLDESGLDTVWSCDHFTNPHQVGQTWFEGWTTLGAVATVTSRVRLGLLVGAIVSRSPMMYVKQAQTVDHVSGGRLVMGLGAGGAPTDQLMWGVDEWSPRERAERFIEYVDLVDLASRNDVVSFDGRWYRTSNAPMAPGFLQAPRPPLLLAAHGTRTMQAVAKHADVWNTFGPTLDYAVAMSKRLDDACGAVGRDPSSVRRSVLLGIVDDTSWTTADELRRQIERWHAAGFDDFIVYDPPVARAGVPVAPPDQVDIALHEVLPQLRDALD